MVCRNEEMNKGGAYPRSCPTCRFGPCSKGVVVTTGMDPKFTIPPERYAALLDESVHIPGDERSRTNPGHGYPAYDQYYVTFKDIGTKEDLEKYLLRLSENERKKAKVIKYVPVEVKFETVLNIQ